MHQSICRTHTVAVLFIAALTGGCATIFRDTSHPSTDLRQQSSPNLAAPYNKPYRVRGVTYYPLQSAAGYRETGHASWYGQESGNRTAMGTRFIPHALTAAHKTLPLPSKVRVTNLQNGHHVDVLVNDRGPFKPGRIIDLSQGAARKIGMQGIARVKIEHLDGKTGHR